jgi:hypothetical protein
MIDSFIKSSFDNLLKLPEVTGYGKSIVVPADTRTEIPRGEEQARIRYGAAEQAVLRRG